MEPLIAQIQKILAHTSYPPTSIDRAPSLFLKKFFFYVSEIDICLGAQEKNRITTANGHEDH